jgi:hypothetical protein
VPENHMLLQLFWNEKNLSKSMKKGGENPTNSFPLSFPKTPISKRKWLNPLGGVRHNLQARHLLMRSHRYSLR